MKIMVSGCLAGETSKYCCGNNRDENILELMRTKKDIENVKQHLRRWEDPTCAGFLHICKEGQQLSDQDYFVNVK